MVHLKEKSLLTLILKLVWRERNRRLFRGRKSNEEAILGSIIDVFKLRLLGEMLIVAAL